MTELANTKPLVDSGSHVYSPSKSESMAQYTH